MQLVRTFAMEIEDRLATLALCEICDKVENVIHQEGQYLPILPFLIIFTSYYILCFFHAFQQVSRWSGSWALS